MRIYTQNRDSVIQIPEEIWVEEIGDNNHAGIFGTVYLKKLGEYSTKKRAKEVLREIFRYYRNGKNSYIMPEE